MSHRLRKLAPGATRLYRFPPLQGEGEEQSQQAQFEFGYRQGVEQGLEQGYQDGLTQGRQSGHQEGHQQGFQAGYQQGVEQGRAEGQARFDEALRPFPALQEQLSALAREKLDAQKNLLSQVVTQVVRRVIQAEFTLNPGQVLLQVEQALAGLPAGQESVAIFLCEEDRQRLADLGMTECQGWPLHSDPALSVGDCRVESQAAVIEARTDERIETCLAQVAQVLDDVHA